MVKGKGYCRPCNNAYGKRYYRANKEERLKSIVANMDALRKRRKIFVDEIKSRPCMDCGGSFPSVCMDFDHREGHEKLLTISYMVNRGNVSLSRLIKEIEKCDVVCANCHRIRTHITRRSVAQQVERTPDKGEVIGSRPI